VNDSFLYGLFPYATLGLLLGGSIQRLFSGNDAQTRSEPALEPTVSVPLLAGGSLVVGLPLLGLLAPGLASAFIASPLRLFLVETLGLLGGLLFAYGLARVLARALLSGRPNLAVVRARMVVAALLFLLTLSGLVLCLTVRWSSAWYVHVVVPYLHSLFTFHPDWSALAQAPLLVRLHVLGAFLLVGVWPFARWTGEALSLLKQLRPLPVLDSSQPPASP
jgi:nitrate reductase gamma subunit